MLPKTGEPPADSADSQIVDDFNKKHLGSGPDLSSPIKLDWGSPFTTPWNSQALNVLADDFLKFSDTQNDFEELGFTTAAVKKLCKSKLERTRAGYVKRHRQGKGEDEIKKELNAVATNTRKNTRRVGVSFLFSWRGYALLTIDVNLQTFHRRIQMGEDLKPENPKAWRAYIDVVDMVGAAGMSSDETETEASRDNLKVVRRHEKNWRSPDLSRFFESVDQKHKPRARGNKPYRRLPSKGDREPTDSKAVSGLPINFYRATWYWSLHHVDRQDLDAKEEMPLPDLSACVQFNSLLVGLI